jgi:hypothetical protein
MQQTIWNIPNHKLVRCGKKIKFIAENTESLKSLFNCIAIEITGYYDNYSNFKIEPIIEKLPVYDLSKYFIDNGYIFELNKSGEYNKINFNRAFAKGDIYKYPSCYKFKLNLITEEERDRLIKQKNEKTWTKNKHSHKLYTTENLEFLKNFRSRGGSSTSYYYIDDEIYENDTFANFNEKQCSVNNMSVSYNYSNHNVYNQKNIIKIDCVRFYLKKLNDLNYDILFALHATATSIEELERKYNKVLRKNKLKRIIWGQEI